MLESVTITKQIYDRNYFVEVFMGSYPFTLACRDP